MKIFLKCVTDIYLPHFGYMVKTSFQLENEIDKFKGMKKFKIKTIYVLEYKNNVASK